MSSPALLLFLELEDVLVLRGSTKRTLVVDAIRTVAAGKNKWRDYQELWDGLFDPGPIRQLKILHDQFEPQYCLTSDWTVLMGRSEMLNVLRLSGLGFVANNLHTRWENRSGQMTTDRVKAIENWLSLDPERHGLWAALGSELHEPSAQTFAASHDDFTVLCCRDVGLTSFETERLQATFLKRLQTSRMDL